jgi:hypothetical protein
MGGETSTGIDSDGLPGQYCNLGRPHYVAEDLWAGLNASISPSEAENLESVFEHA